MATTENIIFKGPDLHQARYREQEILRNDVNESVCSKNIKFSLYLTEYDQTEIHNACDSGTATRNDFL
jgi:hypothetical protein